MDWFVFAVAALAVYRAARMMALEDGPFDVFALWRGWVFVKFGNGWINAGVNCPLCLSFWLGQLAAWLVGWMVGGTGVQLVVWLILMGMALSGAATWLYKLERNA